MSHSIKLRNKDLFYTFKAFYLFSLYFTEYFIKKKFLIYICQQSNSRDSRSYPASLTDFSKNNAKTPRFFYYTVSDPEREKMQPSGIIIMISPCLQTSSYNAKLVFMCPYTSTSPAIRLFLPFAASNWRAAHPREPLVCSRTGIFYLWTRAHASLFPQLFRCC